MNSDITTTVIGALGAVTQATQPIINGINGSLHQQDYISLVTAALFALLGFFTNRTKKASTASTGE